MDRGAWQATVHGVTELDTNEYLSARTHTHTYTHTHTHTHTHAHAVEREKRQLFLPREEPE